MFEIPEDPQVLFDIVAKHLLKQNERSENEDSECLYRGPRGLKCAAGCLIPDDSYHESMEHISWHALIYSKHPVPKQHVNLISELQVIHDTQRPLRWIVELRKLAVRMDLNTLVLDNLTTE